MSKAVNLVRVFTLQFEYPSSQPIARPISDSLGIFQEFTDEITTKLSSESSIAIGVPSILVWLVREISPNSGTANIFKI